MDNKDYFNETGFLNKEIEADSQGSDDSGERAVLAAIDDGTLEELAELARTAGAEVVGEIVQRREAVHPKHYLGKGKVEELKDAAEEAKADLIIANDELSPSQLRNLSKMLDIKVVDRTALILDIFAMRARSAEGRAQVEMAQLKYRLTRLTGLGKAMSRIGGTSGPIGTRGPGETKLETDRRHIRERLNKLRDELKEIRKRRDVTRQKRERSGIPVVALVGYTNAGKSTLMNKISGAEVFVEDKLFATLDTTTRKIHINSSEVLLTDTVGFIQKLPTGLVEAFKSTLEEVRYADILLHVVDASNPDFSNHMAVAYDTMASLGAGSQPVITVFNKMDKLIDEPAPFDPRAAAVVHVSAVKGDGILALNEAIAWALNNMRKRMTVLIPFSNGSLVDYAHKNCTVLSQEHIEEGVLLEIYGDDEAVGKLEMYEKTFP